MPSFSSVAATSLALLSSFKVASAQQNSVSTSQYWHERFHGLLSMAAYGDYQNLCPQQTFTEAGLQKTFPGSTAAPWTFLGAFGPTASGMEGFSVIIPAMKKVVVVLKGIEAWDLQFSNDLTPINDMFDLSCPNCQAHAGAVQVYQEVKQATNSFATAWQAVQQYGLDYSITGHAFGGMVAQVAALDLGWQDQIHWVHSHGSEKVFNQASADLFNSLFEGESAQRTVANEDNIQRVIPAGTSDYTFAGQGFHIFGNGVSNSTYGMSYTVCYYTDDPNCLGGENDTTDSAFYYTDIGNCGGAPYEYNAQVLSADLASLSSSFWATATISQPGSTPSVSASAAVFNQNSSLPIPIATSTTVSSTSQSSASSSSSSTNTSNSVTASSTSTTFSTSSGPAGIAGAAAATTIVTVSAAETTSSASAVEDTVPSAAPSAETGAGYRSSGPITGALVLLGLTASWLA